MSDYIALPIVRSAAQDVLSAQPDAPVVDDGWSPRPARRPVRRSLASTLRSAARAEHRWADRLDPAVRRPAVVRG